MPFAFTQEDFLVDVVNSLRFNLRRICKGPSPLSDSVTVTVTYVMLTGKMSMHPILPVTEPVKKSKVPPVHGGRSRTA